MSEFLWTLPYFDYTVMSIAMPLFILQRAPFVLLRKRMITMYNMIDFESSQVTL